MAYAKSDDNHWGSWKSVALSFHHWLVFANMHCWHLIVFNIWSTSSSAVGIMKCEHLLAPLRCWGSKQICNCPLGFSTITKLLTQSLGYSMGVIISISTILSNSSFNFIFNNAGIGLGGLITGGTSLSTTICFSLRQPISPKQLLYCCK